MDSFEEQIVKQKLDFKRAFFVAATVLAALAASAACMLYLPWIFLPVAAFSGFAIYWVSSMQSWEVEYEVTNGDINIDRIIARRERKTIVRVCGEKIESLLPISKMDPSKQYNRVVMAARCARSATWAFTYHSKKGSTLVLFEPSDRVLEAMRKGLSRTVLIETDRARREL